MRVALMTLALCLSFPAFAQEDVWYDTETNGRPSPDALAFSRTGDVLTAPPSVWTRAGILLTSEEEKAKTLSSIDLELHITIDEGLQRALIEAPAHRVPRQHIGNTEKAKTYTVTPSARGVLLAYDLAASTDMKTVNVSAGHRVSASLGKVVLHYAGQINLVGGQIEYKRGFTTLSLDNPETLRSASIGDIQSQPEGLVAPTMLGGLRIARDPTLNAARPIYAVPTLGGVALSPSSVQAVINGGSREPEEILPGGFDYLNPGLVNGRNSAQFILRDKFGRETVIDRSLYFSSDTLRQGLSRWEVNMGLVRKSTGDTYKTPAVSASFARGLSDRFTLHGGLEATKERKNAYAGFTTYGPLGQISGSYGQSESPKGKGAAWQAEYRFNTKGFAFGASHTDQSDTWWDLSQEASGQGPYKASSLFVAKPITKSLSASLSASQFTQGDRRDKRAELRLDYSTERSSLSASLAKSSRDTTLGLIYRRRFGPAQRSSMGFEAQKSGERSLMALRGSTRRETPSGQLFIDGYAGQSQGMRFGSLAATLDAPTFDAGLRLETMGKNAVLSGSYSSGIWIGEGVREHVKSQSQGVGVVKVPGVEGVPVYLENRLLGTTNKRGTLVIGPLRHLEPNMVRIDERFLPIGYEVGSTEFPAVPNRGHVAMIEFKPASTSALLVRVTMNGQDVPLGSVVKGTEAVVGLDGELYFESPEAGKTYEIEGLCKFTLPEVLPKFTEKTPAILCT